MTNKEVSFVSLGDALYDMKQKLNATGTQLTDWNQNQVNPCTWNSVICDNIIDYDPSEEPLLEQTKFDGDLIARMFSPWSISYFGYMIGHMEWSEIEEIWESNLHLAMNFYGHHKCVEWYLFCVIVIFLSPVMYTPFGSGNFEFSPSKFDRWWFFI